MRTATQPTPFGAKLATFCAALFFVALSIAISPNVLDALTRFGLIHGAAPRLAIPTPAVIIRDLSAPVYAPPTTSPEPPRAPRDTSAAPAIAVPVSAPTPAPAEPAIKIIVVRPADGGAPIVVTRGTKYRGRP